MVVLSRLWCSASKVHGSKPRNIPQKIASRSHTSRMKVLNVAEKNDAAKSLAYFMSTNPRRREGFSRYNKIYEFSYMLFGRKCEMIMTSVSGHLLGMDFVGCYRKWQFCSPLSLFEAPVSKCCPADYEDIKRTLEREARKCSVLIIWTDCDREGENIAFEVIQVCTAVQQNLRVYRAKFSELTSQSVSRAVQNLGQPDKRMSDAVDVRQELDLRIGAAFTRFQTLRLQQVFPQSLRDAIISYGSCQFPTMGFVVERFKAIQNFIPEQFWKIKVNHTIGDVSVDFTWKRGRLFDHLACQVLYDICMERPLAQVENVQSRPKTKWRPLPLETVELEKLASRKLKMNAKETMKMAEKLYTQGYISYPRTETNCFPKEMNLRNLVELQTPSPHWGEFAGRILQDGPNPRQGTKSDQAHPPIHPIKYTTSLTGNEQRLYEFVVRRFLACCSKDAEGSETIVEIDIAEEKFVANGLMILAKNYLDVYPYEKWNAKEIHVYNVGQTFTPTELEMSDGETCAPKLLTEADLIALMEKHGIGTDATHAEHIEKIKARLYVGLENEFFVPGHLGMGLVEGYDNMGFPMSKPNLRAELEADLKAICDGRKDPKLVLTEQLTKYKQVFEIALEQASRIDEALSLYIEEQAQPSVSSVVQENIQPTVCKCSSCGLDMVLRSRRSDGGKYVSCMGFPNCRNAIWFPGNVEEVEVSDETCPECGPSVKKLKFKFRHGSLVPFYPDRYNGCVGGCDGNFLDALGIRSVRPRFNEENRSSADRTSSSVDSGFGSSDVNQGLNFIPQNSRWDINGQVDSNRLNINSTRYSMSSTAAQNFPRTDHNREPSNSYSPFSCASPQQTNRRSSNQTGMVPGNENAIVCNCSQKAVLLTVRKEGPNTGRQFYKCKEQRCNFFLWADVPDTADHASLSQRRNENTPNPSSSNNFQINWERPLQQTSWTFNDTTGDGSEVMCTCGCPAKRITVQKDGPNKGRHFYGCSKLPSDRCNFFMWADHEGNSNQNEGTGGSIQGRRRGGSATQRGTGRPSPYTTSGPKKTRKCGICHEEGHNRKNCPRNQS